MTKKKSTPLHKQVWFPWVAGAIIIPTISIGYGYVKDALAGGQEIKSVKEAVVQQANLSKDLKELVVEQKTRNDLQDEELKHQKELNASQLDALKAIVSQVMKK